MCGGGTEQEKECGTKKIVVAAIDWLPHVLKPDIDFLFFSKWEKVHCPSEGDFCGDLGKEELK